MNQKNKILWVYIASIIFIIINGYFIFQEKYIFSLFPLALFVAGLAFFALDKLLILIVILTPLSIPLKTFVPNLDFDMYLPTEPLLFGILILFLFKIALERKFDKKITLHPVSIAIYINLLWILITSITSTMPLVSMKFFVARIWFVVAFYFLMAKIFKEFGTIKKFYWFYIIPFIIIIFYTIINHSKSGLFDQQAAHSAMKPFYNDHTSYGAIIAMFLPVIIGSFFMKSIKPKIKIYIFVVLIIFLAAFVFSYTRAAWASIVFSILVLIAVLLKIKFRTIFIVFTSFIVIFYIFKTDIIMYLESNTQDSSKDLAEHIKSMSNISSDPSNLERINRWNCAYRMFLEKPFLGWGPGTYMFQYAPFQLSYQRTIISTNTGDMGNAHSEYLGPLSESGILGMLTFLLIAIVALYTGFKVYSKTINKEIKILALTTTLGLITYLIHGFLNNYLDTDKASVLFWGFIAILVALDLFHTMDEETERTTNKNSSQ